jgi:hypothetical protein
MEPIKFNYRELIIAMLKEKKIKDGRWTITVEFGLGAQASDDGKGNVFTCAVVPIKTIGISPVPLDVPDGPNVVNAREVASGLILPPRWTGDPGRA